MKVGRGRDGVEYAKEAVNLLAAQSNLEDASVALLYFEARLAMAESMVFGDQREEAERHLQETMRYAEQKFGLLSIQAIRVKVQIGELMFKQAAAIQAKDPATAAQLCRQALAELIYAKSMLKSATTVHTTDSTRLADRGDDECEIDDFVGMCFQLEYKLGQAGQSRYGYQSTIDEKSKCEEALMYHKRAFDGRMRDLGSDHPLVVTSRKNMGDCYATFSQYEDALKVYEEVLQKRRDIWGEDTHPEVYSALFAVATTADKLSCVDETQKARLVEVANDHLKLAKAAVDEAYKDRMQYLQDNTLARTISQYAFHKL